MTALWVTGVSSGFYAILKEAFDVSSSQLRAGYAAPDLRAPSHLSCGGASSLVWSCPDLRLPSAWVFGAVGLFGPAPLHRGASLLMVARLKRVSALYTENDVFRAVPCVRIPVAAGTKINDLTVEAQVQFTLLTALQQAPVIATLDLFYVPHRLVWPGWVDFASDADNTDTVPVAATNSVDFFDPVAGRSALFRRAYKLAYNEYYGSEHWHAATGQSWYADIAADTVVALYRTANPEPLSQAMLRQVDFVDPTYPVSSPIPLRDFSRQQAIALGQYRRERTGDKYVDALARMGVSLDWRIQQAPERLGGAYKVFQPGKVVSTDTSGLGTPSRVLDGTISASASGKFLAEEGYIVGIISMRPVMVMKDGQGCADGFALARKDFGYGTLEDMAGPQSWGDGVLSGGTGLANTPLRPWYHYGEFNKGFYSSPGAFTSQLDTNSPGDRVYPDPNAWPAANTLSGKHFGVFARAELVGLTTAARDPGILIRGS